MGYRTDWIFTEATYQGRAGEPAEIQKAMDEVAEYREANQPIKERTGGSTFKNPPGHSAWKLIDAAGMRGFRVGGAKVSEMHCNFLINDRQATGEDIETLGETVRARVKAHSGVVLEWEIIGWGSRRPGGKTGEGLVAGEWDGTDLRDALSADKQVACQYPDMLCAGSVLTVATYSTT